MSGLQRLSHHLGTVDRTAGGVANLAQFTVMAIVVADVVGRYILQMPIEWVYDVISRYLMAALFFFSLSWTLGTGEHVRVLFFRQFVSRRARRVFDLIGAILGAWVFALIFLAGLNRFWADWTSGDVFVGAYLYPNWISSICVPIGVGIMLVRFTLMIAAHGIAAATGSDSLGLGDDELF
jgi:TRAP-type mannitol/chloroaromatic compound transport system permease small subunit